MRRGADRMVVMNEIEWKAFCLKKIVHHRNMLASFDGVNYQCSTLPDKEKADRYYEQSQIKYYEKQLEGLK